MKRELKKCPFCGGEFKLDEEKEREYAESRIAEGNGYAIRRSRIRPTSTR